MRVLSQDARCASQVPPTAAGWAVAGVMGSAVVEAVLLGVQGASGARRNSRRRSRSRGFSSSSSSSSNGSPSFPLEGWERVQMTFLVSAAWAV